MKKDFIIPIAVLLMICIVVTGALAATNELTVPIIAQAATDRSAASMRELLPDATSFTAVELTETMRENGIRELYDAYSLDTSYGYIVVSAVSGYGGEDSIVIMLAIDFDLTVIDLRTLKNTETQGLGSRVSEPAFERTFIGADASLEGYTAITGATISSVAYRNAVDHALAACAEAQISRMGYVS